MTERKECFAYKAHGFCNALDVMNCKNCKFFKTKKEVEVEENNVRNRISKLPLKIQKHIWEKYIKLKIN